MSREDNIQTVKRGYEAFGRGDLNTLLDLFSDDIEWITPGPPELATSGRRRGRQQVAEFFRVVNESFEFHNFEPRTFVADDTRVIVLGVDEVTFRATGVRLPVMDWVHIFTFTNNKVTHFEEIFDASVIVAQLEVAKAHT
jgi:ketosteroid isomerase-like protein